jgi:hypothetical protein
MHVIQSGYLNTALCMVKNIAEMVNSCLFLTYCISIMLAIKAWKASGLWKYCHDQRKMTDTFKYAHRILHGGLAMFFSGSRNDKFCRGPHIHYFYQLTNHLDLLFQRTRLLFLSFSQSETWILHRVMLLVSKDICEVLYKIPCFVWSKI